MRIDTKGDTLVIVDFDEIEAYRIACKIEKDGLEFYTDLLGKIIPEASREGFILLIEEEKKHLLFFENAIAVLRKREEDTSEDNDLISSMDYGVFHPYKNIEGLPSFVQNPGKALKLGIAIEDHSIRFYEACAQKVVLRKTKDAIAALIQEEQKHKQLLISLLNKIVP